MPDHVHFIIHVADRLPLHLGRYMGRLKGRCSRAWWDSMGMEQGSPLFAEPWHDRIIMRPGQLETAQTYLLDNPRRLWIKLHNPDLFITRSQVEIMGEQQQILGNRFLLEHFDVSSVHISSKFTPEELHARHLEWSRAVERDGILAGAFISEAEKAVLNEALARDARIILFMDHPFPPRYKPSGKWFDRCASGRLLIVAPPAPYLTSLRDTFLHLNRLADALAAGQFRALP